MGSKDRQTTAPKDAPEMMERIVVLTLFFATVLALGVILLASCQMPLR
jgi:hypothetical protein